MSRQVIQTIVFSFIVALLLPASFARAQYNNAATFSQESPQLNRSVRALGMGNAFVAIDGNAYSPFYNPAGLNDIEEGTFHLMSPAFEISSGSIGLIGDVGDLIDDLDAAGTDAAKVGVLDQFVQQRFGEYNHMRIAMNLITYVRKNFAAGAVFEERLTFAFRDQSLPKFDVRNITDFIFFVSGSYGFWDKLVQVGATVKPMIRTSIAESVDSSTAIADEVDDVFQTLTFPHFGIGVDLGLKSDLSLPFLMEMDAYKKWHEFLKPAFALTWQDIGNTRFKKDLRSTDGNESGVNDPTKFDAFIEREPIQGNQVLSVGAKVSPTILGLDTNFAADVRDINRNSDFISKFHLGVEVILPIIASARLGMTQGYFAAGVGLDLWIVNIDFATYAEETGAFSRQGSNRRYALNLNFNI